MEYPAAYEEVIAVGAVNTMAQKTEESAVGEEVELVAPGEQIISDSMLGLETVVSGTSMAAPHVTGAAAVLWQKDTTKSADFIRGLLSQAANNLGDAEEYGNGLIDLAYALEQYEEYEAGYQEAEQAITEQNDAEAATERTEESTTVAEQEEETDTVASGAELTEEMFIEENESPVETYEDVDYVEGRWNKKAHINLVDRANVDAGLIDQEIAVFKLGAVYPDQALTVDANTDNKVWHGGYAVNYIANYRFATRMAKYAGDVTKYQGAKGQSDKDCTLMTSQVNHINVGGNTYGSVINFSVGNTAYRYNSQSPAQQKKWRKLFLYGMASHIVTDTFAHSAYIKKDGKMVKLSTVGEEDSPEVCPNRFVDAQKAMRMVLDSYCAGIMGSEVDFSPRLEDWGKNRGYYLRNILKYAREAAVDSTESELMEMFQAINYQ